MNVVILGCGRVGARIARRLDTSHAVTVIDWNPAAFDRLGENFHGRLVIGNGIDVDVVKRAGVMDADLFLALTSGDNRNLMAGQVARQLGARKVVVRVYDPVRAQIFSNIGLTTVSPTVSAAGRLRSLVEGQTEES